MLESEKIKEQSKKLVNNKEKIKLVLNSLIKSINYLDEASQNLNKGCNVNGVSVDRNKLDRIRNEQIRIKNEIINGILPRLNNQINNQNKLLEDALIKEEL